MCSCNFPGLGLGPTLTVVKNTRIGLFYSLSACLILRCHFFKPLQDRCCLLLCCCCRHRRCVVVVVVVVFVVVVVVIAAVVAGWLSAVGIGYSLLSSQSRKLGKLIGMVVLVVLVVLVFRRMTYSGRA
ncbi:unnamed protein product [Polarella glacialis]|uniref:Uncharacterized protein n=1 Tax=Polarella glacialis TaxID=89957 RepID=A0A813IF13_POLGL|nr:unnamed protein product [Polarella glacialis]CAE8648651.1 unnamed protein product [Polarella glacialis]